MLHYLDRGLDDFHHHVRLITGASGGMLGAARYVSRHHEGKELLGNPDTPVSPPDYLTPIAWQIAFHDFFPNSLLPWATYNRGDALEDAWIEREGEIALTFGQIKKKEDAGLVPSLIFSPMLVEDGRRLLISNLPLHDLAVIHGNAILNDDVDALGEQYWKENPTIAHTGPPHDYDLEYPLLASVPAVEFFRLFDEGSRSRLTLASAVRMSTRPFPISPRRSASRQTLPATLLMRATTTITESTWPPPGSPATATGSPVMQAESWSSRPVPFATKNESRS